MKRLNVVSPAKLHSFPEFRAKTTSLFAGKRLSFGDSRFLLITFVA